MKKEICINLNTAHFILKMSRFITFFISVRLLSNMVCSFIFLPFTCQRNIRIYDHDLDCKQKTCCFGLFMCSYSMLIVENMEWLEFSWSIQV
jgi:hypothetical protein